jgi:hypothetical protein
MSSKPGRSADEIMTDPWTTERLADLERKVQRRRRRSQLRLLWSLLVAVLLVQAAVAYYSYRQHAKSAARRSPRLEVGGGHVGLGDEHDVAVALAAADAGEPTAAVDAALIAVRPDALQRTVSRKRARKSAAPRRRRVRAPGPKEQAKGETPAAPPVHDLRLPEKVIGNAQRGERIFRMGCGLCHGRTTRRLSPKRFGAKGWKRFFASGSHGRHDLYRSNFTRIELSDVKAYLISRAK